ncbi:unnamed protein product [Symbiodinium necroappetens]|uniref:Uncharacterized protein n=1 Tax=Symbiodinium necroappetens TaxID=1628268 RepID=A0A812NWA6_9DINO|nr:unnamed protein product [Symbiodinium necroappetens]
MRVDGREKSPLELSRRCRLHVPICQKCFVLHEALDATALLPGAPPEPTFEKTSRFSATPPPGHDMKRAAEGNAEACGDSACAGFAS